MKWRGTGAVEALRGVGGDELWYRFAGHVGHGKSLEKCFDDNVDL